MKFKWKVNDKFIDIEYPEFGIGTILSIYEDANYFDCDWEKVGEGDRSLTDPDLIPIEIYKSKLFKVLKE